MMKYNKKFITLTILVLFAIMLIAGCAREVKKEVDSRGVYLKYAKGFKIEKLSGGCKKIVDASGREILLVPRGQEAPSEYKHLPVVYTPVEKVIIASTTYASLMRPLGVLDSVIGVNTDKDQWYIEEIKKKIESGDIHVIGSGMGPLDYDKIVAIKPDLVLIYVSGPNDTQTLKKLEELNIPVAVAGEWLENDPLARVEWVKFIAAFYDKEQQASYFFDNVEKKIEEVISKVSKAKKRPKVLWGLIYQGKAYVSAGDSYVAKMIELAGGDYIFKDNKGTGSSSITFEEFYARGKDADVFIHASILSEKISDIIDQSKILADLPTIKEGKVWDFQPWYWQSVDKTDEIIEDLAAIFYPELFPNHQLRHFKKVPEN